MKQHLRRRGPRELVLVAAVFVLAMLTTAVLDGALYTVASMAYGLLVLAVFQSRFLNIVMRLVLVIVATVVFLTFLYGFVIP